MNDEDYFKMSTLQRLTFWYVIDLHRHNTIFYSLNIEYINNGGTKVW